MCLLSRQHNCSCHIWRICASVAYSHGGLGTWEDTSPRSRTRPFLKWSKFDAKIWDEVSIPSRSSTRFTVIDNCDRITAEMQCRIRPFKDQFNWLSRSCCHRWQSSRNSISGNRELTNQMPMYSENQAADCRAFTSCRREWPFMKEIYKKVYRRICDMRSAFDRVCCLPCKYRLQD